MTGYRQQRVADTIREQLAMLLQQEVGDPRFDGVSITAVETSHDLRHALVYFSLIGDNTRVREVSKAFEKAAGYLRRELAARMQLRYMPELAFRFDSSLAVGDRIETLLHQIHREQPSPTDVTELPDEELTDDED
jgi:ribosome-binding factor A